MGRPWIVSARHNCLEKEGAVSTGGCRTPVLKIRVPLSGLRVAGMLVSPMRVGLPDFNGETFSGFTAGVHPNTCQVKCVTLGNAALPFNLYQIVVYILLPGDRIERAFIVCRGFNKLLSCSNYLGCPA